MQDRARFPHGLQGPIKSCNCLFCATACKRHASTARTFQGALPTSIRIFPLSDFNCRLNNWLERCESHINFPSEDVLSRLNCCKQTTRDTQPNRWRNPPLFQTSKMAPARTQKKNTRNISTLKKLCPHCRKEWGVNGFARHRAACERSVLDRATDKALEAELRQLCLNMSVPGECSFESCSTLRLT